MRPTDPHPATRSTWAIKDSNIFAASNTDDPDQDGLRHLRQFHALYGEYLATEPGASAARIAWERCNGKFAYIRDHFPAVDED